MGGFPRASGARWSPRGAALKLTIHAPHHIALSVTDLARAKWFYGGVLNLKEIPGPPFDFPCAWYEVGSVQLHLVGHAPTRTLRGSREIEPKDAHLAFRVESYRETVERLKAHGVECLEVPNNLTPWAQIYVTDPDGNVIEFNVERSQYIADR